jgi:cytochrome c biogenesis protein CcmG, thiol:disulfide interchange protein DsbE
MRPRKLLLSALAAGAAAALVVFGLASGGSTTLGRRAPELPRERLAGAPVTLADLAAGAAGRPALVVFWASWCEPCAREAPALERLSRSVRTRGRVVGIDWSDSLSGALAFIRRYGCTFSNLRDGDGSVGNAYRLAGLPTSFVLDARGRIRAMLRGAQDEASFARALTGAAHG